MKTLLLALLVISTSAFAEQQTEFKNQAYCKIGKKIESKISDVTKVSENEEEVVFNFNIAHGNCDTIDYLQLPLRYHPRMFEVSTHGFSYPGKDIMASSTSELLSNTLAQVEVRIDKGIFKKKSSKKFIVSFWPEDWRGFKWEMTAKKANAGTEIDFEGFEPL